MDHGEEIARELVKFAVWWIAGTLACVIVAVTIVTVLDHLHLLPGSHG
jgi:hypothetical protein